MTPPGIEPEPWSFDYEIASYLHFGPEFARKYTGMGRGWAWVMRGLGALQGIAPGVAGRYGKYPIIVVKR